MPSMPYTCAESRHARRVSHTEAAPCVRHATMRRGRQRRCAGGELLNASDTARQLQTPMLNERTPHADEVPARRSLGDMHATCFMMAACMCPMCARSLHLFLVSLGAHLFKSLMDDPHYLTCTTRFHLHDPGISPPSCLHRRLAFRCACTPPLL